MAHVEPLAALHYDPAVAGPLQDLAAPPRDVIDPEQRAELQSRSPHNVVALDLPEDPAGGDRYEHAARLLEAGAPRARSCTMTSPSCGRSSRTTPRPTAGA
jgi:uncharacterized protein (DUF1015 family)